MKYTLDDWRKQRQQRREAGRKRPYREAQRNAECVADDIIAKAKRRTAGEVVIDDPEATAGAPEAAPPSAMESIPLLRLTPLRRTPRPTRSRHGGGPPPVGPTPSQLIPVRNTDDGDDDAWRREADGEPYGAEAQPVLSRPTRSIRGRRLDRKIAALEAVEIEPAEGRDLSRRMHRRALAETLGRPRGLVVCPAWAQRGRDDDILKRGAQDPWSLRQAAAAWCARARKSSWSTRRPNDAGDDRRRPCGRTRSFSSSETRSPRREGRTSGIASSRSLTNFSALADGRPRPQHCAATVADEQRGVADRLESLIVDSNLAPTSSCAATRGDGFRHARPISSPFRRTTRSARSRPAT